MTVAAWLAWAAVAHAEPAPSTLRGLVDARAPQGAVVQPYRRRVALVIGIGEFEDPSLRLPNAPADALAVGAMLTERFGFDDVHTLLDAEATRPAILGALSALRSLDEDDALVVFWAGHGATVRTPSDEELGYLVPWEGSLDPEHALVDNISMEEIRAVVGQTIPARHKLLIVDACYGGLLTVRGDAPLPSHDAAWIAAATRQPVFQIIAAGQADESVLDVGPDGHSVFTGRLLEALAEVDDFVTGAELGVLLQRRVRADAWARGSHQQTPAYGRIAGVGDFVLVLGPASGLASRGVPPMPAPPVRRPLTWTAVGAGAAAGVSLGLARMWGARYQQAPVGDPAAESMWQANQIAGWTGYSTLGLSVGLATAAVVRGEW